MYRFLKKYVDPWGKLSSILPLGFCFLFNNVVYFATAHLLKNVYHYDFTLEFDRKVPVVEEFIWIYVICYLFWIANYLMIGHFDKKSLYQFVTADLTSRVVCLLFFVFLPTTNIRPEIGGDSLSWKLLEWIYAVDLPANLFPSIHCLVSWFCYIGIRGKKEIPKWYRVFSCLFAIAVMASTQFTKQHYIVDVIGAVILAEVAFYCSKHGKYYVFVKNVFEKLNCKMKRLLVKSS